MVMYLGHGDQAKCRSDATANQRLRDEGGVGLWHCQRRELPDARGVQLPLLPQPQQCGPAVDSFSIPISNSVSQLHTSRASIQATAMQIPEPCLPHQVVDPCHKLTDPCHSLAGRGSGAISDLKAAEQHSAMGGDMLPRELVDVAQEQEQHCQNRETALGPLIHSDGGHAVAVCQQPRELLLRRPGRLCNLLYQRLAVIRAWAHTAAQD